MTPQGERCRGCWFCQFFGAASCCDCSEPGYRNEERCECDCHGPEPMKPPDMTPGRPAKALP